MRNLLIYTFCFLGGLLLWTAPAFASAHHDHGENSHAAMSPFDSPDKTQTDSRSVHCILRGHFNHICPHSLDAAGNKKAQITRPCASDPASPVSQGSKVAKQWSEVSQAVTEFPQIGRILIAQSMQPKIFFDPVDPPPRSSI